MPICFDDHPVRLDTLSGEIIELAIAVQRTGKHNAYGDGDFMQSKVSSMGRVLLIRGDRDGSPYIKVGGSVLLEDSMVLRDWTFVKNFYWLMGEQNGTT